MFNCNNLFAQYFIFPDGASRPVALKQIDSLKLALEHENKDSNKVRLWILLSEKFHYSYGEADSAMRYAKKAMQLIDKVNLNQWWKGRTYWLLGNSYKSKQHYAEALNHYFLALEISQKIVDKKGMAAVLNDIGIIYSKTGYSYAESSKYFLKALKIAQEIDHKGSIYMCYYNMGFNHLSQDNYNDALQYFFDGLKVGYTLNKVDTGALYLNIAHCYLKLGMYKKAEEFNTIAYTMSVNISGLVTNRRLEASCYLLFGIIYNKQAAFMPPGKANQKYSQAIQNLHKGISLHPKRDLPYLKDGYLNLAEVYTKIKNYNKALEYTNKYVLLYDSIQNMQTKNSIEQLRIAYEIAQVTALQKGKYERSLSLAKAEQEKLQVEKRQMKNLLLFGIFGVSIISALLFLLIRQRNLRLSGIEKAKALHRMTELELQSLRAQLNPHFMFNSLNSIQELILLEENEKSNNYLSAFADLLRMLLDNGNQPFISLRKELEFLEVYLSLENLRITNLDYAINIDPDITTNDVKIPNMILQPYIENAIWHGLSPKKSNKKLYINITKDENNIIIEIIDNGIGRKKAAELKSHYKKQHKSKGMELLSDRFNLLSKEYGTEINVNVIDLYENANPAGTRVEIILPSLLSEKLLQAYHDKNYHY